MSQTKFFKSGGFGGEPLKAIYLLEPNNARRFSFGSDPEAHDLPPGSIINNVVEIKEKEFENYLDSWISLAKESVEEFVPKTEYQVIFGDEKIIGYSSKTQEKLIDFFELRRGLGFFVKDEDGSPIASIGPEISSMATYTTWEL